MQLPDHREVRTNERVAALQGTTKIQGSHSGKTETDKYSLTLSSKGRHCRH